MKGQGLIPGHLIGDQIAKSNPSKDCPLAYCSSAQKPSMILHYPLNEINGVQVPWDLPQPTPPALSPVTFPTY